MITDIFDKNGTRYRLVQENSGNYNWLFLPGGPGADSRYFLPLIESLQLPGKTWLIDLPGNGDNISTTSNQDSSFEHWLDNVMHAVQRFDNPILVGHSFGAMLALLIPELEKILAGLIILSSAPIIGRGIPEAEHMLTERNIKPNTQAIMQFLNDQTDANFRKILYYQAPAHFPEKSLSAGREMLTTIPFSFKVTLWWFGGEQTYAAKWVPSILPTLIIGGTEDCINPIALFLNDSRFKRDNITIHVLNGSGHFPWFENLQRIKEQIEHYVKESICV